MELLPLGFTLKRHKPLHRVERDENRYIHKHKKHALAAFPLVLA